MFVVSRTRAAIAAVGAGLVLAGCQQVPMLPGLKPYRMNIQQGNVLTQDMVGKLKPGMTRQQVRFVMGTPPIADTFHQDRWDYVYYLNKAGRVVEHRRIVLLFEGDTLKRIEGDVTPLAAAADAAKTGNVATPPKAAESAPSKPNSAEQGSAEEKGLLRPDTGTDPTVTPR
jgi:outer membrane protein assembly factor BamE